MLVEITGAQIEKIKQDFADYLDGLNMTGKLSYSLYCAIFDKGTAAIQKAYDLGKQEQS